MLNDELASVAYRVIDQVPMMLKVPAAYDLMVALGLNLPAGMREIIESFAIGAGTAPHEKCPLCRFSKCLTLGLDPVEAALVTLAHFSDGLMSPDTVRNLPSSEGWDYDSLGR